jgi:hypothetical protein
MRAPSLIITALVGLTVNVSVPAAHAATATFVTPTGATTGGGPVDASAAFITSAGSLSVTLTNLQPNITDVSQALSDLSFVFSNGSVPVPQFSSSGQLITVNSGGTFTTGSTVPTGWALIPLNAGGTSLEFDALGTPTSPARLIIGPPGGPTYSNANGSIAGNGPHNPFLNQLALFTIGNPGITADTTITAATFSFGTTEGAALVPGVPPTSPIPIPGALPLFATGLAGLALLGWRRKKAAAG